MSGKYHLQDEGIIVGRGRGSRWKVRFLTGDDTRLPYAMRPPRSLFAWHLQVIDADPLGLDAASDDDAFDFVPGTAPKNLTTNDGARGAPETTNTITR